MCSKFIGISDVDVTLSQVKKYDNKLVDFVDRMLKVIRDILDVDLTSDEKSKRKPDHSFKNQQFSDFVMERHKKMH